MEILIESFSVNQNHKSRVGELEDASFPAFLNEEPTWRATQADILEHFAPFHFLALDAESGKQVGVNINVPFCWDGTVEDLPTYNGLLKRCLEERLAGRTPTALVGILGAVAPDFQSKGVFQMLLQATAEAGGKHKIAKFLSPVRPSIKQFYPNFSIDEFCSWRNDKGEILDHWINYVAGMAGPPLAFARDSITLTAPIVQWEQWAGMALPVSGEYVIPGGHQLLRVDRDAGTARYGEDHVWFDVPLWG